MSLRINKRKNPFPQRNAGTKKMAVYRSMSVSRLVQREIMRKQEIQEFQTTQVSAVVLTNGYSQVLNNITQGIEYNNRIGRAINSYAITIDYAIYPPTTTGNPDSGFVALVWDSQPNASAATFANIFDTTSPITPGQAMKNTGPGGQEKRFKICWIDFWGVIGGQNVVHKRKWYKCKEGKTEFNTASQAVAITGAYYYVCGSNQNSTASTTATHNFNCKYQYTD